MRLTTEQAQTKRYEARAPQLRWERQFIRYAVVGVATNGTGYLLFYLLTTLGLSPVVTISIIYPTHLVVAFFLNKRWSFAHRGKVNMTAVKYLIAYGACYLINVGILELFADYLGFSHLIVQACAIVLLACLLFAVQRYWVFRQGDRPAARGDPGG
jgi:putative flippase GtrA